MGTLSVAGRLTYGELFAGYGGMYLGLSSVLPGELAWYSEIARPPAKVMAHHHPESPNLGDVTAVDWTTVAPVDVLTGGTPCQDLSSAGKRAGMRPGTRSGLWASMLAAINTLRPSLVVWENVRGATSAPAHSAVESCQGCMGNGPDEPDLRALGRVVGDLANSGYDAWWIGLPASDVGAAHRRWRIFVLAAPSDNYHPGWGQRSRPVAIGEEQRAIARARALNATPELTLLPTPAVNDMGGNKTVDWWDAWTADLDARLGNSNGHGKSLGIEARRLEGWEQYAPALERWASIIGRPAPPHAVPDAKLGHRLSPRFAEWMMGLPDGWVSGVHGISAPHQLTMLGNGVVPQQVAAAAALWLSEAAP